MYIFQKILKELSQFQVGGIMFFFFLDIFFVYLNFELSILHASEASTQMIVLRLWLLSPS